MGTKKVKKRDIQRCSSLVGALTDHADENTTQKCWLYVLHTRCHTVAVLQIQMACASMLKHGNKGFKIIGTHHNIDNISQRAVAFAFKRIGVFLPKLVNTFRLFKLVGSKNCVLSSACARGHGQDFAAHSLAFGKKLKSHVRTHK